MAKRRRPLPGQLSLLDGERRQILPAGLYTGRYGNRLVLEPGTNLVPVRITLGAPRFLGYPVVHRIRELAPTPQSSGCPRTSSRAPTWPSSSATAST
jgi:hypothetical protein